MFTGIVREVGVVRDRSSGDGAVRVRIEAPKLRPGLALGGSIAVDGVCLTVTDLGDADFAADVVPETLERSRLGDLVSGDRVNLEAPLRAGDFLDGHLVQGHVDATATIVDVKKDDGQTSLFVELPRSLSRFVAEKGSVALNGVSLTVASVVDDRFGVALIPTTLRETNLGALRKGDRVNVEVDIVARYVARLAGVGEASSEERR
jgi:riboflavin synthase